MAWVVRPKFDPSQTFVVRRRLKISGVEVHVGQEVRVGQGEAGGLYLDKRVAKRLYDSEYLNLQPALHPTADLPAIPAEVRLDQPAIEDLAAMQARKPITAAQALAHSTHSANPPDQPRGKAKGK